eukprot:360767-Hanusia_phi.AAC.2
MAALLRQFESFQDFITTVRLTPTVAGPGRTVALLNRVAGPVTAGSEPGRAQESRPVLLAASQGGTTALPQCGRAFAATRTVGPSQPRVSVTPTAARPSRLCYQPLNLT